MKIIKALMINIFHTLQIFFTNLKRNFLREFLVGIGIILGVSVLIIATTFGDGFELLLKNSILSQIKYEEIKVKATKNKDGSENKITIKHINEIKKIEGIVEAYPMTEISFQISALMKIPIINRTSILGLVGNAIPSQLADSYIEESLRDRFPNGFHKTNGITPVLFSNFIYEAVGNWLKSEGIENLDLRQFLENGYTFDLRMGKSMFDFSSTNETIDLPDGRQVETKKLDEFINKRIQEELQKPTTINPKIKQHPALNYKAGSQIGNDSEILLTQVRQKHKLYNYDKSEIKFDFKNPYEVEDYNSLINENFVEKCMFVGSAPINFTFTLSLPLEVVQAYDRAIKKDTFVEGYSEMYVETLDATSKKMNDELEKFYKRNNLEEDQDFKTLKGITKVINDAVKSIRPLVIGIGVLLLFLSAIGIFYSFMYIITRRSREIGLYRFFGATRGKVIFLLVLESTFVGLLCSSIAYFFCSWLVTTFLPNTFDIILNSISPEILKMVFQSKFTEGISFSDIFTFDYGRSQLFMWLGVLISMLSALLPAVKGSYTSLFKTISS